MPAENIYNAFAQPVRSAVDYANDYERNALLRQNVAQNALALQDAQTKSADAQRTRDDAVQIRTALSGMPASSSITDRVNTLIGLGTPTAIDYADKIGTSVANQRKTNADADKAVADADRLALQHKIDIQAQLAQAAGTATDQASWNRGLQIARSLGVDTSNLPQQFDPVVAKQLHDQSLTGVQQLDQVWKQRGYDLDVTKQNEVARHNRADEGLTRERLTIDQQQPKGILVQSDQGPVLADPRTGKSTPVVDQSGKPLGSKQGSTLTEGQAKALGFGSRMVASGRVLDDLGMQGVDMPVLGGYGGSLVNAFGSAQQQQVEQAQRDWVNAILRRESGAAISPSEFDSAKKQYFAQPGDKPGVIAQKRQNRLLAEQGVLAEVPTAQRGSFVTAPSGAASTGGGLADAIAAELARRAKGGR